MFTMVENLNTAYYLPPWLEHQTFKYRDRISRSEFIL